MRNCVRNEGDDNGGSEVWMEDCRVDMSRARLTEVRRRQVRRRKLRAIEIVWRAL